MALKISESAAVQMPMKTVASLIAIIAIGTWAYFGIHEKLNQHSTKIELMQKDLDQNSEFRIKYPRGELGQSAGEAELFMIVEHVSGLLEDVEAELKSMSRNNAVNIEFLKKRTEKLTEDVEKIIRTGAVNTNDRNCICTNLNFKRFNDRTCIQTEPRLTFEIKAYRAERGESRGVVFTCKKVEAQTEIYMDRKKIIK